MTNAMAAGPELVAGFRAGGPAPPADRGQSCVRTSGRTRGDGLARRCDRAGAADSPGQSSSACWPPPHRGRSAGSTASISSSTGSAARCAAGAGTPRTPPGAAGRWCWVRTERRRSLQGRVQGRPQGEDVGGEGGSPPRATSGAKKAGVPCTRPVEVKVASPRAWEMPKSLISALPSSAIKMLPGLTSRCTIPTAWAAASAEETGHRPWPPRRAPAARPRATRPTGSSTAGTAS